MNVNAFFAWLEMAMLACFSFGHFTWLLASIFRNICWYIRFAAEDGMWHVAIGHTLALCFLFLVPTSALVFLLDRALR